MIKSIQPATEMFPVTATIFKPLYLRAYLGRQIQTVRSAFFKHV